MSPEPHNHRTDEAFYGDLPPDRSFPAQAGRAGPGARSEEVTEGHSARGRLRRPPSPSAGMTTRRRIASAALLALLIAALLLAVPSLRGVFDEVGEMQLGWVLAALGLEIASCLAFVAVFRLFFEGVHPTTARRVAWTEMASGALLPGGGVTALAAGGWLIRLTGMPAD